MSNIDRLRLAIAHALAAAANRFSPSLGPIWRPTER